MIICEDRFIAELEKIRSGGDWRLFPISKVNGPTCSPIATDADRFPQVAPADIALLQHSSGTTAVKKGVMLSHSAIITHVQRYRDALALDASSEVIVSWLPYYHDMGLIACFMLPLIAGFTVVLQDPFEWAARPLRMLALIEKYRAGICWLPNFAFEHIARAHRRQRYDLSSVRAFINCSEPCRLSSFAHFAAALADCGVTSAMLQTCYASAETVFAVTQSTLGSTPRSLRLDRAALEHDDRVLPRDDDGPGIFEVISCGAPIPGVEVAVLDAMKRPVGDGAVGRIAIRGDAIFDGYYGLPEETAKSMADGWYVSRDLGFLRDAELYVLGREDDLIIVNGKNLFAHEVEYLLSRVPGLKPGRGVAFGVFSDDLGSEELIVVAEISRCANVDGRVLQREIKQLILDHTAILARQVRLVEEGWLVKTTSGKISRSLNRDKYFREQSS